MMEELPRMWQYLHWIFWKWINMDWISRTDGSCERSLRKFAGGPVGLDTLAAALGEDAGTLEDVYEPYLLKNGFLNRTARGRVATQTAYEHLGIAFPE